ncbi:hypothetical protein Zmor_022200 [Zophobas morio]|uniref:Uncharacterized protein n=1 Tax=Zophobas morio TaxID=2755281 RepID=A0AA38I0S2_9CUCU|nr:hypothetical protein Zmor_022200 [Zophobas morio]
MNRLVCAGGTRFTSFPSGCASKKSADARRAVILGEGLLRAPRFSTDHVSARSVESTQLRNETTLSFARIGDKAGRCCGSAACVQCT